MFIVDAGTDLLEPIRTNHMFGYGWVLTISKYNQDQLVCQIMVVNDLGERLRTTNNKCLGMPGHVPPICDQHG